jgi:hypothetical protein
MTYSQYITSPVAAGHGGWKQAANVNAQIAANQKASATAWRGDPADLKKKKPAAKTSSSASSPSAIKQPRGTTGLTQQTYPTVAPYTPPAANIPSAYMPQSYPMPDLGFDMPPAYMPSASSYQQSPMPDLSALMANSSWQLPPMQQMPPAFMANGQGYQPQQTQFNQPQFQPQASPVNQGFMPGSGIEHIPQAYMAQSLTPQQMNMPANYAPQGSAYTGQGGDIYGGRRVEDYRSILGPSPITWPTQPSGGTGGAAGGAGAGGIGGGMGGLASGMGQVSTNPPTPQQVFDPSVTQGMVNQAAQTAFTNSDPTYLMKQFTQPGVSHSAGTMSSIMPQLQAFNTEARSAQQLIPLQNQMANAAHLGNAQYQQGQQGLAQFDILRQLQNQQSNFGAGLLNSAISPLFGSLFA